MDLKVYEVKQMPVLVTSELSVSERSCISGAFKHLVNSVELVCKADDELEKVKSKDRKNIGLFEIEARKGLAEALEKERKAREQLDEAVYDALGLTPDERRQVQRGLKELQEIRRLRTEI